jgi:KDO2-lipid IV(A) lauroyltransferase
VHLLLLHTKARVRDAIKLLGEAVVGALTIGLLRTTRYFDPIKTANLFGRVARIFGPMMLRREQRIGRANLTAAFPEKTPEEIETIFDGRLGQSRPAWRRVRPSRSYLGARSRAPRGQPD